MARILSHASAVMLVSTLSLPAHAQQARFDVIDLGPAIQSMGINEHGDIVGIHRGGDGLYHGFHAGDGFFIDIGSLGAHPTFAREINALGHIVGSSITAQGREHAFLYRDGQMIDLGTFGGTYSHASDINDAGQIVGDAEEHGRGGNSGDQHAFIWENGRMTDLGTLGGAFSQARAINELGHVVGWAWNPQWDPRPFFWTPARGMIDLGDLGGGSAIAADINDLGHVVGSSHIPGGLTHATLWRDGRIIDLNLNPLAAISGSLGNQPIESFATGINNAGQIVGLGYSGFFEPVIPFLWERGLMRDLNRLIDPASGWVIIYAEAINNHGEIAASARGLDGRTHAVRLVPLITEQTH